MFWRLFRALSHKTYLTIAPATRVSTHVYAGFVLLKKIGSWDAGFWAFVPELTGKVRIMNFDRIKRMKASAFALLRRDKSGAATMAMAGESATVGRANTQRAERKIGRVRLRRAVNRSIWGSTESHPTLSKLRGRGVMAWKFLVTPGKRPSDCCAANLFPSINWRKTAFLQKHGIGPFFKSGSSKPLQAKMIRPKMSAIGAGNFSNFWRISPGYTPRRGLNEECGVRSEWVKVGQTDSRVVGNAPHPKVPAAVMVSHAQSRQTSAEWKVQPRRHSGFAPIAGRHFTGDFAVITGNLS